MQQYNGGLLPLTEAQSGVWFAQDRELESCKYNTSEYIEFKGQILVDMLKQAMARAIDEVEGLHASFKATPDGPRVAFIRRHWEVDDYQCQDILLPKAFAFESMDKCRTKVLSLSTDVLFKAAVYRLDKDHTICFLCIHHIVIDGYAMQLLWKRIALIYNNLLNNEHMISTPSFCSQQQLLQEENDFKESKRFHAAQTFFHHEFSQCNDFKTMSGKSVTSDEYSLNYDVNLCDTVLSRIDTLAIQTKIHRYSLYSAVIAAYIYRITGEELLTFGVPLMGRMGSVSAATPCMKVNILPVKVHFSDGISLLELSQQIDSQLLTTRLHQGYRSELLFRELKRFKTGQQLYGPMINIMPDFETLQFGALTVDACVLSAGPIDDIAFFIRERKDGIELSIKANPKAYLSDSIQQHGERFYSFMSQFSLSNMNNSISKLPLLLPNEQQLVTSTWNNTYHEINNLTLSHLLLNAMHEYAKGGNTALLFEDKEVDYQCLLTQVSRWTRWLHSKGVKKGDRVAVAIPRQCNLIFAQQAILQIGAVYVPIDCDYPQTRMQFIFDHCESSILLTTKKMCDLIKIDSLFTCVDDDDFIRELAQQSDAGLDISEFIHILYSDDPAYMIYTSGSTGKPKGVVVSHGAIVNRLQWMQNEYSLSVKDRVLQKTPAGFDVSIWEFFWPLMYGAAMVITEPNMHKDPIYLADIINNQNVTTLHFVPSMLNIFIQVAKKQQCQSLRQVFCSGEALPVKLVEQYYQLFNAPLYNLYGPTEAAVDVTYFSCKPNDQRQTIPIGVPVWNTQILILDKQLQLVPPEVIGELYICGAQLASGYWKRDDLTAERFLVNPFCEQKSLMYKSGDLAAWNAQGQIEYHGRNDFQVKIRGNRIEMEEIEVVIAKDDRIAQVVVDVKKTHNEELQLVAYIVLDEESELEVLELTELKPLLEKELPQYMHPSFVVNLPSMPLTPNGKLDRKQLPQPELKEETEKSLPETLLQERLCGFFVNLLGGEGVGIDCNFFEMGGHSLLAARLCALINKELGISASLGMVFSCPTVRLLAENLTSGAEDQSFNTILPLSKSKNSKVNLFGIHPAGGLGWCYSSMVAHLPEDYALYAVQSPVFSHKEIYNELNTFEDIAHYYADEIVKVQPQGPYHLFGWSIGGNFAPHVATFLQQQGHEVKTVTLLDAYPTEQLQKFDVLSEADDLQALALLAGVDIDKNAKELDEQFVINQLQQVGSVMASLKQETIYLMIGLARKMRRLARENIDFCYEGNLLYFHAAAPKSEDWLNPQGWQSYIRGELKVVDIQCTHAQMIRPDIMARIVSNLLKVVI